MAYAIFALLGSSPFVMAIALTALLGCCSSMRQPTGLLGCATHISIDFGYRGGRFSWQTPAWWIFGGRPKTFFRPSVVSDPIQLGRDLRD